MGVDNGHKSAVASVLAALSRDEAVETCAKRAISSVLLYIHVL